MAQLTDAISGKDLYVALSTDGAAWTDISGESAKIAPGGGERKHGEGYTFDGDKAVLTRGKREPGEVTVSIFYREANGSARKLVSDAYLNNTPLYVRYAPGGNTTGKKMNTSDAGIVKTPPYPEAESESADPLMLDFDFVTPGWTESTIP